MAELFDKYWAMRAAKAEAARYSRPLLRSFPTAGLDETEALLWKECKHCQSILDVGAGDNRVKGKFLSQGFSGRYLTCDVSREFDHDFHAVEEVNGVYDAVLVLEVIEHLSLGEFYHLMDELHRRLSPNGIIIVSTPNPACINSMWAGDMTHVQQYPLNDLIAFFLVRGFECDAYRVLYSQAKLSFIERLRLAAKKVLVTKVLGADYADGLLVVGKRLTT